VITEPCSGCGATLHLHTATPTRPLLCSECRNPGRPCPSCRGTGEGALVFWSASPVDPSEPHETHTHREPCGACKGTGRAS
jgi:hypothetical protein